VAIADHVDLIQQSSWFD